VERTVNPGAGVEVGKAMFTISDVSVVWVIANVPDGKIRQLKLGTPAEVHSPELGTRGVASRVSHIDPLLNEDTRTGRVRIEIANPGEKLKLGMFVTVDFKVHAATPQSSKTLAVPEAAVQRVAERAIVFVAGDKEGRYEAREVELGDVVDGFHPVRSGLKAGDRVVTTGSFTLKTQLMKGELAEE
jgi:RND family efflux transporter MFP subunit